MERVEVFITGDVIGVGFRSWIYKKAVNFGLTGWVENVYGEKRGVRAVFEGSSEVIAKIIKLCESGPEISWVDKIDIKRKTVTGNLKSFTIKK